MLSHQEPDLLGGTACPRVQRQGLGLKMPPSQGDGKCPVSLAESWSRVSQLSAREARLSKVLTGLRGATHTPG